MRRLSMFNLVTLDGYFEGPNHDISWHHVDAEFNEYAVGMRDASDTFIFGRRTYELMAGYWPTPEGIKDDPVISSMMNSKAKVVFSRTLGKADWNNTRLVKSGLEEEIRRMKALPGKELTILGSGSIVSQLAPLGLIDEFRILVNPVVLGAGTQLFNGIKEKLSLTLLGTKSFKSGNVLLRYAPAEDTSGKGTT